MSEHRQAQRSEHERVCRELLPEVRDNALLNACLRQIVDGVPTEGALLNAIRVLVARAAEQDATIAKLLLEKPLKPMQVGGMVFTPPGWSGPR